MSRDMSDFSVHLLYVLFVTAKNAFWHCCTANSLAHALVFMSSSFASFHVS